MQGSGPLSGLRRRSGRGWALLALAGAALLAGCARESRLDAATTVDVCALMPPLEVERILGPQVATPQRQAQGGGVAGNCTWSFPGASGMPATLSVMITTQASAAPGPKPSRFFEVSRDEVRASLGAEPWPLEELGDEAYLYQTRRPDHAELWMRQAETVLVLRTLGGSAAQLEQFARILERELMPR